MTQPIRKIHWNSFPATTRQRLVDSFAGRAAPRPIVSVSSGGTVGPVIGWSIVAGVFGVLVLASAAADFGSVYSFRQPLESALLYLLFLFLFFYGAIAIVRVLRRKRAFPWAHGRYLFAMELIDAQNDTLEIFPTASIENVRVVHHYRNGVYTGSQIELTFPNRRIESVYVPTQAKAQETLDQLREAQNAIFAAAQRNDFAALRELDVLAEVRGARELDDPQALAAFRAQHERETGTPIALPLPLWARQTALVSLGAALVLGMPLFFVRNALSDAKAYEWVQATTSSVPVEAYLAAEGSESEEARAVHLPRTKYLEAEQASSVTALRAFVQQFPTAPQVPSARASIHRKFAEAQAAFLAQAPNDPRMRTFVLELLTFLEAHDTPQVKVRFAAPSAAALTELDAMLDQRGRRDGGHDIIAIAPHFTPERTAQMESTVTSVLAQGFRGVVADDILDLVNAGRIEKNAAPDPTNPVFDVSYVVEPSDALYTRDGDNRAFVGIHVNFEVTMRIPSSATTYTFAIAVEPPQTFTVQSSGYGPATEGEVYSVMAARAFDQLATRLASTFFASAGAGAVNTAGAVPFPPKGI